jgi:hypothetical protein
MVWEPATASPTQATRIARPLPQLRVRGLIVLQRTIYRAFVADADSRCQFYRRSKTETRVQTWSHEISDTISMLLYFLGPILGRASLPMGPSTQLDHHSMIPSFSTGTYLGGQRLLAALAASHIGRSRGHSA